MADTSIIIESGFYDSINRDRLYSADDMNKPYKDLISEGVYGAIVGTTSTAFAVTAGSGLAVSVAAGKALLGGRWVNTDEAITLEVPAASGARIDSVILRVDTNNSARNASLIYRTGSASAAPALVTSTGITELRLANVSVASGATSIAASNITDTRTFATLNIANDQLEDVLVQIINDHPELITTIPDGSITKEKLTEALQKAILMTISITDTATTMGTIVTQLNTINTNGEHVVFDVSALNAGMYLCTIYLGAGFYRIADLVTGFEATGFYSAEDLLVDIIKNGSQTTGKHYTVQWDKVNAQCTRLNDAASITTDTTNFGYFGSVNENYDNPFDSIYPWSGRKLCNIDISLYMALSDGDDITACVTAWEDDVNFDYEDQYGVWVYTPAFFGRCYEIGNYRYYDVTDENLQNNIAYPPSLVGRWLGRDITLTIDGSSKHCNIPSVGMPMANIAMSTMHTYAKNYGASLNDIYSIDAVSLLYIVEYANMNLQNALGSGVSGLYQQTLHPASDEIASHTITINATSANFIVGAIVDIGTTDGNYNIARTYVTAVSVSGSVTTLTLADAVTVSTDNFVSIHGLANLADEEIGSHSGYIGVNGRSNAYYRGQTFYGNKFQYILGAYRQTGTGEIWVAEKGTTDDYDALNTSVHKDTGLALTETSGYVKSFGIAEGLSFAPFCTEVGGNTSNPVGDYCYVPSLATANTVLLLGGCASYGANCGWSGDWYYTAGSSYWNIGSCPRLLNP